MADSAGKARQLYACMLCHCMFPVQSMTAWRRLRSFCML